MSLDGTLDGRAIKRPGRLMEIFNFGAPWAHGVRPGTPKIHPWAPGAHGVRPGTPQGPWGPGGGEFPPQQQRELIASEL